MNFFLSPAKPTVILDVIDRRTAHQLQYHLSGIESYGVPKGKNTCEGVHEPSTLVGLHEQPDGWTEVIFFRETVVLNYIHYESN